MEALTAQIEQVALREDQHAGDKAAPWKPDNSVSVCMNCGATRFSAFNRRVTPPFLN